MKQLAHYQDGRLEIQDVPRPIAPPGGILVRTTHSLISVGTEKMKVEVAKMNLLQKARARPDQVRKVLDTARNLGWKNALDKVRNRLETPTTLGYSAAGVVVDVHPGNTRFRVGDRVACAGAECAFHAEYLGIPDMLAAPVPAEVSNWQAAYTTMAAIALQAVRQTEPKLGDQVLVMGQGLVGLLVTNLLRASGVRVMAVDVQASRRAFAQAMGAERVVILREQNLAAEARAWTNGFGVDAAIICTATQSNEPIESAAEALRDRGRLVDVGITKIELPWKIFYEKELEVRFSRSYGPGRYDPSYEWAGSDYPIGYVRWTEQRNFQACLDLMSRKELHLDQITTRRVPFAQCLTVYRELLEDAGKDIGVILEYGETTDEGPAAVAAPSARASEKPVPSSPARISTRVPQVDVIGAGNFARTMLLPHLQGRIVLGTVVNQTALSAQHTQKKFGFASATTDRQEVLGRDENAAVLIGTRPHLHADLVAEALRANRHVFVEKPLCLNAQELAGLDEVWKQSSGTVQVGFNRRFAPASLELKRLVGASVGSKTAVFRVLTGRLDPEHWTANYAESGGRIVGDACHYFDYFCFLFAAKPVRVTAQPIGTLAGRLPFPDSVAAQIEFSDGSCGQLLFSADGDPGYPKETLTVVGSGLVADLTNFQRLTVHAGRKKTTHSYTSKGHAEQIEDWLNFLRGDIIHPFPYPQARQSMEVTFAVLKSIQLGRSVDLP